MSDHFKIPDAKYPDERKLSDDVLRLVANLPRTGTIETRSEIPPLVVKAMVEIATNAWKAKAKMVDTTGEVRDEMKRVHRHVEAIFESFRDIGLNIKDHTGDPFDYGLPLKVVTSQPQVGITNERVIETIKPTIYWHNQILQQGEVVIAIPSAENQDLANQPTS